MLVARSLTGGGLARGSSEGGLVGIASRQPLKGCHEATPGAETAGPSGRFSPEGKPIAD